MGTQYLLDPTTSATVFQSRIEPRAIAVEYNESLGAQVHDALWMLTQQWRIGEYKGMDGGSALNAKIKIKSEMLRKYELLNGTPQFYTKEMPLEKTVEAIAFKPDILMRIQLGKRWLQLLEQEYGDSTKNSVFTDQYMFGFTASDINDHNDLSDDNYQDLLNASIGKLVDGYKMYIEYTDNLGNGIVSHSSSFLNDTNRSNIKDGFLAYMKTIVVFPVEGEDAWNKESLEYQYKVGFNDGSNETVLSGDNQQSGKLEWYDMDIDADNTSLGGYTHGNFPDPYHEEFVKEYLTSPMEFKGMPVERWWEFEDRNIDLATMLTKINDVSKLMVMEFGLIYSNDWMLIPQTLKIGSINKVDTLVVTDVFGKHTKVDAAGTGLDDDWQRWSMFTLNKRGEDSDPADTRLFLPPTIAKNISSEPVEQVYFVRDEMANMVWGLEEIVPSSIYGGKRGSIAETELEQYFIDKNHYTLTPPPGLEENEAEIKYELMNSVPENWIPFIPVNTGNNDRQIQFRRAAMYRVFDGVTTEDIVRPRTEILSSGIDGSTVTEHYHINEEEILRPGVVVKTSFQRARWFNGEIHTWLGRTVTNGRGEANSGLEFDMIKNKE